VPLSNRPQLGEGADTALVPSCVDWPVRVYLAGVVSGLVIVIGSVLVAQRDRRSLVRAQTAQV
jgi:hypothetical protein